MKQPILGIDIGGTGIVAGVLVDGHLEEVRSIPTPANESQEVVLNAIAEFIEGFMHHDLLGIGIGIPGLVDVENGIVLNLSNIPAFQHVHLREFLENRFRKPVFINNDANCFALGVQKYGVGRPYKNLVGITLGTGVGGGIVINGHLYSGVFSAAGEWCSAPYLDHDFEYYCSGKFFNQVYKEKPKTLAKKAEKGDLIAIRAFNEYGKHLGALIKHILYAFAPEAIVLGGSIRKTYPHFQESLFESLKDFRYPQVIQRTKILISELDETAVHGAVALVEDEVEIIPAVK
ncbi:ROK family protein [Algoriphagus sediminis]|uniref:ROK family protein n=1 Tax=Algoriphagus sediminis TaxID=3057113 RepID=A0ABT7Y8R5_9BACT|nr:ROK family protein [Algoriphagus sediminis]MDN3202912.1 ROK family protein [Algoriphagus sediminis]